MRNLITRAKTIHEHEELGDFILAFAFIMYGMFSIESVTIHGTTYMMVAFLHVVYARQKRKEHARKHGSVQSVNV